MPATFLITGCSSGLGESIALSALRQGHQVIATSRKQAGRSAEERLKDLSTHGALILNLELSASEEEISQQITKAIDQVGGRLDVLINNAGYILSGGIEECSLHEVQEQFDINVFGGIKVLKAALPFMRRQKSGVVAMLGSLGGWHGYVGSGYYCATKACCSIIAESLRDEVAHLGITVTSIEPGRFRTNFLSPDKSRKVAKERIADLDAVMKPAFEDLRQGDQEQPGNPKLAGDLIVELLTRSGRFADRTIPPRFVIGSDAVASIRGDMDRMKENIDLMRHLSVSTDY